MQFQFESLNDFLTMSGHGPYVWACYAIVTAVFVGLAWNSIAGISSFKRQQRALLLRQQQAEES